MHWATAMSKIDGVQMFHARHEHCACGMAMGYYSATGKTGVASVTCGAGVTQITTALSTAVRARVPMVVFAGESPMHSKWYNQYIEQAPVVARGSDTRTTRTTISARPAAAPPRPALTTLPSGRQAMSLSASQFN